MQRGNVGVSNLQVVNAILYVAERGCKWHGLPKRFGNWRYDIEREILDLEADARRELRQRRARPVADALQKWLLAQR